MSGNGCAVNVDVSLCIGDDRGEGVPLSRFGDDQEVDALGTDVKAICTCFFSSTLVVIRVAGWSGGGQLTAEVDSCGLLFSMLRKCSRWSVIGEEIQTNGMIQATTKKRFFWKV